MNCSSAVRDPLAGAPDDPPERRRREREPQVAGADLEQRSARAITSPPEASARP